MRSSRQDLSSSSHPELNEHSSLSLDAFNTTKPNPGAASQNSLLAFFGLYLDLFSPDPASLASTYTSQSPDFSLENSHTSRPPGHGCTK